MSDYHRWMYDDWSKSGAHSNEWMVKTQKFIIHAFYFSYVKNKRRVSMDLYQFGFMLGYKVWVHHGESQ